jgi:hypothetical protein
VAVVALVQGAIPAKSIAQKAATRDQHCPQLIFYYDKAAQKVFAIADLHEKEVAQCLP